MAFINCPIRLLPPAGMSFKHNPPFRAEHIGSLLRPDYLLEARRKFDTKKLAYEQLRELEDKAVEEAICMQREVGIKSLTDGEYRSVQGRPYYSCLIASSDVTCLSLMS